MDGTGVGERLLNHMRPTDGAQSGVGHDLGSVGLSGQHHAAIDRLSVEQHGASAALADLASVLDIGVSEITQRIQEHGVGLHFNLVSSSIHHEADLMSIHVRLHRPAKHRNFVGSHT